MLFWGILGPMLVLSIGCKALYLTMYESLGASHFLASLEVIGAGAALAGIGVLIMRKVRDRPKPWVILYLGALHFILIWYCLFEVADVAFYHQTGENLDLDIVQSTFGMHIDILFQSSFVSLFRAFFFLIIGVMAIAPVIAWLLRARLPKAPLLRARRTAIIAVIAGLVVMFIPTLVNPSLKNVMRGAALELSKQALGRFVFGSGVGHTSMHERPETHLVETSKKHPNVVVILMESTRRDVVGTYNPKVKTTPNFDKLARESLVFERAHAPMPVTAKALVALHCGIYPFPRAFFVAARGVPQHCLPELLEEQGYSTLFIQASSGLFQFYAPMIDNLGFGTAMHLESLDTTGFEHINYLGYEESTMLEPSREWLKQQVDAQKPFWVTYLTLAPHHDYSIPEKRIKNFHEKPLLNRYMSGVHMVDDFIGDVMEILDDLGVREDTIVVLLGDHGEAFGSHGVYEHNGVIYEEALSIPWIIHIPGSERRDIEAPITQLDFMPVITKLMGFDIVGGEYDSAPLEQLESRGPTMHYCWYNDACMALIDWPYKYIYHYGRQPEELFHLEADPGEKKNLNKTEPERLKRYREQLMEHRDMLYERYNYDGR